MSSPLRLLVVDGYDRPARQELAGGGASVASDLYVAMLRRLVPGADCDVVFPADPDSAIPDGSALADYDGVAWTGSSLTVHRDDDGRVRRQVEFARAGFRAGVPAFGSCWAAQIAVTAAGGLCARSPRGREMGIGRKIRLTPEGRGHPMYTGKRGVFDSPMSHEDEITHLPPGAVHLAANDHTAVQAVSVTSAGGDFWAVQYHPEYDLREIARITQLRLGRLVDMGFFGDRAAGEGYVAMLDALHQDPSRRDLAWMLGIDHDVLNTDIRQLEVRNWIERKVLPRSRRRQ